MADPPKGVVENIVSRLIFINRFYRPDSPATSQLLTDLAERLSAEDENVIVLTSCPGNENPREVLNGVEVRRLKAPRMGNSGNLVRHAVDLAGFTIRLLAALRNTVQTGDIVIFMTDPPLLPLIAQPLVRRKGVKILHWIQDIYPEAIHRVSGRSFAQILRPWRDRVWRLSDGCVTLGQDMAKLVSAANVPANRLALIPNWAPQGVSPVDPTEASALRREWGLEGKFVILYFGNFGRVHQLDLILSLATSLGNCDGIHFCLVGPGPQKEALKHAAKEQNLNNVSFHPSQPRERRSQILALGHMHLITLKSGCEDVVFPSKLYGICAAGKPVLFLGPKNSEISRIVEDLQLGLSSEEVDFPKLCQSIQRLVGNEEKLNEFGRNARQFYLEKGNAEVAANHWSDLLARLRKGQPIGPNNSEALHSP